MLFVLYIDKNPVFFKLTGTGILCTWWMVVYKPSRRWKEISSWNIKNTGVQIKDARGTIIVIDKNFVFPDYVRMFVFIY